MLLVPVYKATLFLLEKKVNDLREPEVVQSEYELCVLVQFEQQRLETLRALWLCVKTSGKDTWRRCSRKAAKNAKKSGIETEPLPVNRTAVAKPALAETLDDRFVPRCAEAEDFPYTECHKLESGDDELNAPAAMITSP